MEEVKIFNEVETYLDVILIILKEDYFSYFENYYKDTPIYKKFVEKLLFEKRVVHSETI